MTQGWEIKKLDDLCQIELGKTPYRGDKTFWDVEKETDNVWLSIADLLNTEDDVVYDSKEYISDKAVKISKVVKGGTLLLSFKLTLGRLAFAGRDLFTNEAIAALKIKNEKIIDKYFLYHFLSFLDWNAATESDVKVKGKTLNKAKLKEIKVHFPRSPKEQKRIVSILDKAFAAIDKAKVNAEQNLKNTKELFESYLQDVFDTKDKNCEERRLEELIDNIITGPFGSMLHKADYVGNGIPVVNPQNIIDGKIVSIQKTMISEATFSRLVKYALKYGDIVIARRGEMGRCAIVKNENVGWLCGTGSFVIRVNKNKVDCEFLNIILSSEKVKKQLEKSSIGATMSNLNQSMLSKLLLNVPPIIEQQSIVKNLNAILDKTKKLENIYKAKISKLDELKKSILHKAFSGELLKEETLI